jgi:hypothetical protein
VPSICSFLHHHTVKVVLVSPLVSWCWERTFCPVVSKYWRVSGDGHHLRKFYDLESTGAEIEEFFCEAPRQLIPCEAGRTDCFVKSFHESKKLQKMCSFFGGSQAGLIESFMKDE